MSQEHSAVPPLTVEWLRRRGACEMGLYRFGYTAPSGSLPMDNKAAESLAKYQWTGDLLWLLEEIIGVLNAAEVYVVLHETYPFPQRALHIQRRALHIQQHYRLTLAAACVAAWQEYHR